MTSVQTPGAPASIVAHHTGRGLERPREELFKGLEGVDANPVPV